MTYIAATNEANLITFDLIGAVEEISFLDTVKFIRNQLSCSLAVAVPAARLLRSIGSITIAA